MKKKTLMILLIASALADARAEEKDLMPRFERVRAIDGSFTVGERGRVAVPGDVFGQARDFPSDVRIIGGDGIQWPFFLHISKESVGTGILKPEILNRSFVEGDEPYLQFDLVIPQGSGKPPVHNRLELVTSGHDFVRRVEVFGKDNGRMAAGYLIDFSHQHGACNRMIRYPVSDAARLHVRIYPNAQRADETFNLASAQLHYRNIVNVKRETVDKTELPVPEREKMDGAQTWLFDLGHENRPVRFMMFKVATSSYARSVSVYGRNNEHEPWKWVGGGEIHALKNDEQTEIKLGAWHRFLKAHVFHYDDQPLDIDSIQLEAVPRYLVFEAATEGDASLYYRAWDLKPPNYDLQNRIEPQAIAALPVFQTLEAAPNEAAKSRPWRKYSKWLGIAAVGGVSLLVIGIISSMLKQQKEQG